MARTWLAVAVAVLAALTGCTGGGNGADCPAGASACRFGCSDYTTDPANCGGCGQACAGGQSCVAGRCTDPVLHCTGGLTACGAACVDLATSTASCGACGQACLPGQGCAAGRCTDPAVTCSPGFTACGQACLDLSTSVAACGACGHACLLAQTCVAGACSCPAGTVVCGSGGACTSLQLDADNCGACGTACPSGGTCVAGACEVDASAFRMLGGDAGHSGFNAGETGVPPLTLAWTAAGAGGRGPAVLEGGRVFSVNGTWLHALLASSGAELWSYNFGAIYGGVGWPAVSGGKVYVATSNNYNDTWLRQFDRATGEVGFKVAMTSQWEQYWSPIVVGTTLYTNGGTYGGLYGFDLATAGTVRFFTGLEQYDEWSPAYHDGKVYTFVEGKVRAHDPATGQVTGTLDLGWTWQGWSATSAPVFGSGLGFAISPPNLVAFDPATLRQAWTANGAYTAYPAVAGGRVLALSNGNLIALDAATGARQWLFAGDDHLVYPPVAAAGYVYVASDANVYAVDAATHQQVWTAPGGGRLAIGAGMLFVSGPAEGSLVAYRLTR